MNDKCRLFRGANENWYVESSTGFDGPFTTQQEAERYLALLDRVWAAGIELAWLEPNHQQMSR